MNIVCEVCGDVGYIHLLLCCSDCEETFTHQYCLDEVLYDASSVDWFCNGCHQRHSEGSHRKSLGKVPSERPSSHTHFDTTSRQQIAKSVEPAGVAKRVESANPGSVPQLNRTDQSDLQSNIRNLSFPVRKVAVNQVSRLQDGSGTILSFKHIDQDKHTDQHTSVICKNMKDKSGNDHITVAGPHQHKLAMNKDKPGTHGNSSVIGDLTLEREKKKVRFQVDHEASNGLQERSMVAANGPQPSIPRNGTFDEVMTDLSNTGVLPKENSCLPSVSIANDNLDENSQLSKLLDQDNSSISSGAIVLEASATAVEIFDTIENFRKDKSKKRRRLILDDDDEVEEEKAEDVKRRRRYIAEDEDGEDIVGSANVVCALNDATNRSLNFGAKMVPQTLVAADHSQQSSPSHSESDDQQNYVYTQALDELIWSGTFKIDTEVLMLDARLSTKACPRVRELSTSLQPVVVVNKLPRSQVWPKSWESFGPTDENIGLFFFPHNLRQNEVSNILVNDIIQSDGALKVTVGIADLLIFPSSLLPEQYHFFQGNHYLWGAFKKRKDMTVLVKEQDGSGKHDAEQGQQHEQDLLDQKDEALYESSDQETFAVKHLVPIENRLLAKSEAVKAVTREGTTSPGSSLSSAKPNSPKVGSNCSVAPRNDSKLDAPGDLDQQEYFTSLPEWNASSVTEQSSVSGPAEVSTKLVKPVEHGHDQLHSGSEPSIRNLFVVAARGTPRCQQLIQEMVSEGALLFPVPEKIATTGSVTGSSARSVSSEMNSNTERLHLSEPPQALEFVSIAHGEPGADSEACLELFPVGQERIGWAPRAEASKEVDLDLSLGKWSGAPSLPPLL